jgi:hypothetical protein
MRSIVVVVAFAMIGFLLTNTAVAQKTKYQSIFIYNFSKYIKWSDNVNDGKFVIGILGHSDIQNDLESMVAAKKQRNGMNLEIRNQNSISEVGDCNLLYVNNKFCNRLDEINASLSGKPSLIVTDKSGMAQKGAAINFIEKDLISKSVLLDVVNHYDNKV